MYVLLELREFATKTGCETRASTRELERRLIDRLVPLKERGLCEGFSTVTCFDWVDVDEGSVPADLVDDFGGFPFLDVCISYPAQEGGLRDHDPPEIARVLEELDMRFVQSQVSKHIANYGY